MWTLIPGVPIGCRSPRKRGPYSMPSHTEELQKAPRGEIAARGAGAPLWEDSVASECIL